VALSQGVLCQRERANRECLGRDVAEEIKEGTHSKYERGRRKLPWPRGAGRFDRKCLAWTYARRTKTAGYRPGAGGFTSIFKVVSGGW